ncbi:MAG: beta-xylosidase [Chitinophagaceae bacterium]|nr:MAG: beta-xylosidase [Chitinophagaceae bacterium]
MYLFLKRFYVLFASVMLGLAGFSSPNTSDPAHGTFGAGASPGAYVNFPELPELNKAPDTLNPVIPGDFADPTVISFGNSYYAAGTSSEWAPHFPIYKSNDLINWKQVGHIFPTKQPWMSSSFWAPELYVHRGKVYAYYTVRDTSNISCIGVATAESPEGPFTDHGVLIRTGKEAIDAFVFDDQGQLHVSWKAYGLDKRPIELLSSQLSDDGLSLTGEVVTIHRDDAGKGMEGQSIIKHKDYYYLFYSAGSCCGVPCDYNVRVTRSRSINGPFEEFAGNPILKAKGGWMCTGHGTPVLMKDGRWFYLYHAYNKQSNVYTGRQGMLAEIVWDQTTGWPSFHLPSVAGSLNNPDTHAAKIWAADFKNKSLDPRWSWDYRHSRLTAVTGSGQLHLSGEAIGENRGGHVLCIRTGTANYEVTTKVSNKNDALKGLVLYGDYDNQTGIGVRNNKILVWTIKKNVQEIVKEAAIDKPAGLRLKMEVSNGNELKFFYASADNRWILAGTIDAAFTRQWDRAPRPGLIQDGAGNQPAVFSEFVYKVR